MILSILVNYTLYTFIYDKESMLKSIQKSHLEFAENSFEIR